MPQDRSSSQSRALVDDPTTESAKLKQAPPVRSTKKSGYLPGLDGLRAIAILGVLMTHDLPWTVFGHSNEAWKNYGGWGVELFFAISGVLICWRLLEDEAKQGELRLGAFYTRRLFRIQPAALTYLLVIAVLFALRVLPVNWLFWWSAVLSFTNFLVSASTPPGAGAFLGHFWTLSVEEHFYIVISLLFLFVPRRRTITLAVLLAALLAVQQIAYNHGQFVSIVSDRRSYWVLQFLLFPALLALCVRAHRIRNFVQDYVHPWTVPAALAAIILIRPLRHGFSALADEFRHWSWKALLNHNSDLIFYGFGVFVIAIMLHPASPFTRFLELRPLRFVGRISYSLYLWHILFFIPIYLPDQIHSRWLMLFTDRPLKYVATAACALLSYYLIERPLIRYGHRVAPPATEGHRDLEPEVSA